MATHGLTLETVMETLEGFGNEGTKKVLVKHGAREPFFGVKVQDLKKLVKKIKKDHALSLALYATGNSDAMYLAGLIADPAQISRAELQTWVAEAYWYYISEYTVPWVAGESPHGNDLGFEWIESDIEGVAAAGWATLAYRTAILPDEDLDIDAYRALLARVVKGLHDAPNRVRYVMNGFVIAVASNVAALTGEATAAAKAIGKVDVELGGKGCKVPLATTYIQKVVDRGTVGKKRKSARK